MKAAYQSVFDEAYLKERIEKLLPDNNFYFYQVKESETEQKQELEEIERYLNDGIQSPLVYIERGEFQPVHLIKAAADIIISGLKEMIYKCNDESRGVQVAYSK